VAFVGACTFFTGREYFAEGGDQLFKIVFCALCVLVSLGGLGFAFQFLVRPVGSVCTYLFFGFLFGLIATSMVSGLVFRSDPEFAGLSWGDYVMMSLILISSASGAVLVYATDRAHMRKSMKNPSLHLTQPDGRGEGTKGD